MKELQLRLKFSIFISPDCAVTAHRNNILHHRVHANALHEFLVTIKRLNLRELVLPNLPHNSRAVNCAADQVLRVALAPAQVHHVTHMSTQLTRVAPLHYFL